MDKQLIRYCRKSNELIGLSPEIRKDLVKEFSDVNVDAELKRMCSWLKVNKHRKGSYQFIVNWMINANKFRSQYIPENPIPSVRKVNPALDSLFDNYLQALWKNREHILQLNTQA